MMLGQNGYSHAKEWIWIIPLYHIQTSGSDGKESARNAGDPGLIPGLGRFPGGVMATHSSNLAWKIPWTEEPGGLQSMGLQGVRHDWVANTFAFQGTLDSMVMSDLFFIKGRYIYLFEKSSISPLPSLTVLPLRSWVSLYTCPNK